MNPSNGLIEYNQVFDTYISSEQFDRFIEDDLPEQYIIVAACKDECTTKLSEKGRQWFSDMGSKEIWNLGYRQSFAFIGISGAN